METRWTKILGIAILLIMLAVLLGGCDALAQPTETAPNVEAVDTRPGLVSATGEVVPHKWAALNPGTSGRVLEVLVAEGDRVATGQVLVKLDGNAAAQAKLEAARSELVQAQQALDALNRAAAVQSATAQQAVLQARLDLIAAQRKLEPYTEDAYEQDVDRLRQDVVDSHDRLKTAQDDFDPYKDFDPENSTRKSYETRLEDAQHDYDEKLRKQEELELEKTQAEQAVALAQARLDQAQSQVGRTEKGADEEELRVLQARMTNAQAQVTGAEAALADLELRAPFPGTVTRLSLRAGEWVTPASEAVTLADLATLYVETTDVNEIDAARLSVGDSVTVTFDALPDLTVSGKIERIGLQAAEGSGVNYTVVIGLHELPEALRWGMTAFVDIEAGE